MTTSSFINNKVFSINMLAFMLLLFFSNFAKANIENSNLRPDSNGTATKVEVSIFVLDIEEIDNLKQDFTADFLVLTRWKDARLAGDERKEYIEDIWSPNIEVLNGRNLKELFPQNVEIDKEGNVQYRQRYYGNMSSQLDLKKFPFDTQTLTISLVSVSFEPSELDLSFNADRSGRMEYFSSTDWDIGAGEGSASIFKSTTSSLNQAEFIRPMIKYNFPAKRHIFFYLWKVILPLLIIVFMSWAIFYIDPIHVGPQLGLAATSILTLIAFLFSLGRILPPIAYLTKIDFFVYSSLAMVFLAFGEAVLTMHLGGIGEIDKAKRIDKKARFIFPMLYLLIIITFFVS